jgi:serine/threonine protein phosphatase PrpC
VADHPQRNVLLKVLRGAGDGVSAQVSVWDAVPGDRYLLCSDGLSDYVSFELIEQTLIDTRDPGRAIDQLIDLTLGAGAPDNVTCVIGDIVPGTDDEDEDEGSFVGAAEELGIAPLDVADQKGNGFLESA